MSRPTHLCTKVAPSYRNPPVWCTRNVWCVILPPIWCTRNVGCVRYPPHLCTKVAPKKRHPPFGVHETCSNGLREVKKVSGPTRLCTKVAFQRVKSVRAHAPVHKSSMQKAPNQTPNLDPQISPKGHLVSKRWLGLCFIDEKVGFEGGPESLSVFRF